MLRENWYRDLWLLVLTVMVVVTLSTYQKQRQDAIRVQCVDQNARHDYAERVFLTSPLFQPPTPLSPAGEKRRVVVVKAFAQTMIPRRDCEKLVRRLAP